METIFVAIIVALAVGYLSRRFYRALKNENTTCSGCACEAQCKKEPSTCKNNNGLMMHEKPGGKEPLPQMHWERNR